MIFPAFFILYPFEKLKVLNFIFTFPILLYQI